MGIGHSARPRAELRPYLLTDDPFHLEELQFQANQILGFGAYHRTENKLQIVYPGETRGFAWSMRTMFQLAAVTPQATPSWLKPRAYWKRIVDDNLTWFTRHYVDNPAPPCAIFFRWPAHRRRRNVAGGFRRVLSRLGRNAGLRRVAQGVPLEAEVYLARRAATAAGRVSGAWPYYIRLAKSDPDSLYTERSKAGIWLKTWKEAWEMFRANPENEVKEPFPDTTSWARHNDPGFLSYTRGVLALATHLTWRKRASRTSR